MQNLRQTILAGALGVCAAGILGYPQTGYAQESVTLTSDRLVARKLGDEAGVLMMQGMMGGGIGNVQYVASEMSFDGKVVKGAPYSAQAVTESTQTLADGNRIHRTSTASVYRDTEGRTRREQTMMGIGPLGPPGDAPQTIFINDPVANTRYMLEPRNKVARQMPAPPSTQQMKLDMEKMIARQKTMVIGGSADQAKLMAEEKATFTAGAVGSAGVTGAAVAGGPMASFTMAVPAASGAPPDVKTESLGTQVIEGVSVEGTRTTMTIAAGQIGNDRSIEMISERWYSPDLQTVVMTRHTDPRMGETVYKLTNLSRSEPSPTLFQVPSDYTVSEKTEVFQMRVAPPVNK